MINKLVAIFKADNKLDRFEQLFYLGHMMIDKSIQMTIISKH